MRWYYTWDIHNYVTIKKERLRINTTYDNILLLLDILAGNSFNKMDMYYKTLFYDTKQISVLVQDWNEEDHLQFIEYINKNVLFLTNEKSQKIMDIKEDAEVIFSSFYHDYGTSLIEKKGKMTWIEFLMLLDNLSSESAMGRLIQIRTMPEKDLSPEMRALKHRVRLKDDEGVKEKEKGLINLLKTWGKSKKVSKNSKKE